MEITLSNEQAAIQLLKQKYHNCRTQFHNQFNFKIIKTKKGETSP